MDKYTVLLLKPDSHWSGHQSDWITREHVKAVTVEEAYGKAQDQAKVFADQAPEDYAVLAVYPGHIFDHFVS